MAPPSAAGRGRDPRALRIVAKSIYRELRANGYDERDAVTLAGELLAQVSCDIRERRGQGA